MKSNPQNDLDDIPKAHQEVLPQDWHNMALNEADRKQFLRAYYACTYLMDDQAGRVLEALHRLGQIRQSHWHTKAAIHQGGGSRPHRAESRGNKPREQQLSSGGFRESSSFTAE